VILRVFTLLAAVFVALPAHALPRFAARTGATCQQCHTNPTGGGLRSDYGSNVYGRVFLPAWAAGSGVPTGWSPTDDTRVRVGTDLRAGFVAMDTQVVTEPTTQEPFQIPELVSLFLMQADVYASVDASEYLTLYADYGLASQSIEAFGMVKPGVADSYAKIGAFVPPYGLKLANHRSYIREDGLGIDANLREAGVEVGTHPGPVRVIAAVFNGGGGAVGLNPDYRVAASGMADVTLDTKPVRATLGGSAWWQPGGDVVGGVDQTTLDLRVGGYWTVSAGPVTYLGEADHRRQRDPLNEQDQGVVAMYHELAVLPVQGVDIIAQYESFDPDIDLRPNLLHRVGAGVEFFPVPHLELKLLGRHTLAKEESLDDPRTFYTTGAARGMTEIAFFTHFYL
jgi:hypothetical protein